MVAIEFSTTMPELAEELFELAFTPLGRAYVQQMSANEALIEQADFGQGRQFVIDNFFNPSYVGNDSRIGAGGKGSKRIMWRDRFEEHVVGPDGRIAERVFVGSQWGVALLENQQLIFQEPRRRGVYLMTPWEAKTEEEALDKILGEVARGSTIERRRAVSAGRVQISGAEYSITHAVVGISSENLAKTKTLGTYPIRKRRAMQLAWLERVGKAKVESAPKNLLYMGPIESDPRPKSLGVKDNGWWSGEKV